jgi:hypothetical protein
MLDRVLSAKLREYAPANTIEQDNVLQEVMQHYVLASLSRAGLFADAIFHWSTARQDVQRFLPLREQESLSLWDTEFFLYYADMMEAMAP